MVDLSKSIEFKNLKTYKDKKQIIITETKRPYNYYINSLKYRYNKKNPYLPNYVINKSGEIFQIMKPESYSSFMDDINIDKNCIIISLENLGWLQKEPLTDYYVNWIGDIYNGEVFERKWRDYYFWQPYTEEQIDSLVELCKKIFGETKVEFQIIGHNTKITDFHKYEGLLTRSNYNVSFTDVSPAFNFEDFIKKIGNG